MKKKISLRILSSFLAASLMTFSPTGAYQIVSEAHGGRTDAGGGHRDNKNASGLGSYHYHCGGHPAHLHSGGVCPYAGSGSSSRSGTSGSSETDTAAVYQQPIPQYGWKQNNAGWYYQTGDTTYYQNCFAEIDSHTYYFNAAGNMVTEWQNINGIWCYFGSDGHLVRGLWQISGEWYYFDQNGCMLTGWQTVNGKTCYFHDDGHRATGITDIAGQSYYFNPDGSVDASWDYDKYEENYENEYDDWFD